MSNQQVIEPGQDLIVMPKLNMPVVTEVVAKIDASFDTIYTALEEQIADLTVDLKTEKGRKAISSLAYKISRVKTGLDDKAGALTDDQKAMVKAVNASRLKMRETLDGLRDKARKPLDDWQIVEDLRTAKLIATFDDFSRYVLETRGGSCDEIQASIDLIDAMDITEEVFQSRFDEALSAKKVSLEKLDAALIERQQRDKDAAELEELRAAKAKAEAEEEERQRAETLKLAKETEDKQRAEEKAAEEVRQEAANAAAAKKATEEAQAAAAEEIAAAERDAATAKQEAEDAKKETADRLLESEKQAKLDAEALVQQERDRQAQEIRDKKDAEDLRAADIEHRRSINGAALVAMIKVSDISEDQAKMIIRSISESQIPHISISY